MNRLTRLLFGHLRLTPEERSSTEALTQAAISQRSQAQEMARKIQYLEEHNHFGERIRKALIVDGGAR